MNGIKLRIYMDNCCYNRPFDDQSQLIINIESVAKLFIQSQVLIGKHELIWSDILEYENSKNPFEELYKRIIKWKTVAKIIIQSTSDIIEKAKTIMESGIKSKDALHIASAIYGKADYFLTTDKGIIKKANHINEVAIVNPIDFVKEMENENEN